MFTVQQSDEYHTLSLTRL